MAYGRACRVNVLVAAFVTTVGGLCPARSLPGCVPLARAGRPRIPSPPARRLAALMPQRSELLPPPGDVSLERPGSDAHGCGSLREVSVFRQGLDRFALAGCQGRQD